MTGAPVGGAHEKTAAVRYSTGRQGQRAYQNALALLVGKGIRD